MSNLSFTINWDQDTDDTDERNDSSREEESRQPPSSHGQAWEINFSNDSSPKSKKPPMPKFLMERQQFYSSISRKELIKKDLAPTTDVAGSHYHSSIKPSRSSSSPWKVKGPKPVIKSSPPSRSHTSPPKASGSSTLKQEQVVRRSLSPKKSPNIKKPLLPMTSPTKKPARSHEFKSQSESFISPGASSKALKGRSSLTNTMKTLPHSVTPLLGDYQEIVSPSSEVRTRGSNEEDNAEGKRWIINRRWSNKDSTEINMEVKSLPTTTLEIHRTNQSRLATTPAEMAQRKVLDLRRWYCMCHPQYSKSCGISSVVSCWNYLFSTLGNGSLPPLTQEDALDTLGFQAPFEEIQFGPFTGNATCMRWFEELCLHYGMSGQPYYFYKPKGKRRTAGINPELALERLQDGLNSSDTSFIYHCYNHYFCPIGYEKVPRKASDAYKVGLGSEDVDTWILLGEPSRKHPAIHVKRWENVVKDLMCESPHYFNIRYPEKGILIKNTKKMGNNLHCIMAFKKVQVSISLLYRVDSDSEREEMNMSEVEELNSSDSEHSDVIHEQGRNLSIDLEDIDGAVKETVDYETCASGLKRSGTFTKDKPTVLVNMTRTLSSDSEYSIVSSAADIEDDNEVRSLQAEERDDEAPVSGLKRSGTFTKDAPVVCIQRTRLSSSEYYDSDSSINDGEIVSGLKRSNEESNRVSTQSSGIDSNGDSNIEPETTSLERSGVFKSCFVDIQSGVDSIDINLDETLKASDYIADNSSNSE